MAKDSDFDRTVSAPPGLRATEIKRSIQYIERELAAFVEVYYEQANVFSALVGIFGTKALDSFSTYEKRRHTDAAQQRFPDLKRRGSGEPPSPQDSLECKASKRPWALQSHYDHPGWYVVWRYLVDPTRSIEEERPVVVWRADVAFLEKDDWKYEGSSAGSHGGGRTHTFGLVRPREKLKNCAIYRRSDVKLVRGKPVPANGESAGGA